MYGDLGGDDAVDDEDEEPSVPAEVEGSNKEKVSLDSVLVSKIEDSTPTMIIDPKAISNLSSRDYSQPPPCVFEETPYTNQDVSFTRLGLFSKTLKGQGFSTFLLQSLPDLKKLFRIDTK